MLIYELSQINNDIPKAEGISPRLASLLYARGARDREAMELFLHPGEGHDISMMQMFENSLHDFISADHQVRREPERITLNVADLLDDLIRQADELVGKPVALMTKDDKVKAIRYLSNSGALLITKSGDKIARHFGISKYTLYSYLDNSKTGGTNDL